MMSVKAGLTLPPVIGAKWPAATWEFVLLPSGGIDMEMQIVGPPSVQARLAEVQVEAEAADRQARLIGWRSRADATIAEIDRAMGQRLTLSDAIENYRRKRGKVETTAPTTTCVNERTGGHYECGVRGGGTGRFVPVDGQMVEVETLSGGRIIDVRY
jgi:hypothetical protein